MIPAITTTELPKSLLQFAYYDNNSRVLSLTFWSECRESGEREKNRESQIKKSFFKVESIRLTWTRDKKISVTNIVISLYHRYNDIRDDGWKWDVGVHDTMYC